MSDHGPVLPRRGLLRSVLVAFGAVQVVSGLWALLAPRSFYEGFPLGRGWVELLPAYNEHLVRDLGGLYLATAALLLGAGIVMTRAIVTIACVSWLLFALPHAVYHAFNLEPYGAADAIANAIVVASAVLLPAWVLLTAWSTPHRDVPRTPAAASSNGRIDGIPDGVRNPLVRATFRESRRRYGAVMEPLRVFAHHPTLLAGYGALEMASERSHRLPARLKHIAELRAAMICGCEWCLDFGSSIGRELDVSDDELRELPRYRASERFTEAEKLVLDYATGMSRSPVDVPDALFDRLRDRFDRAQLVELTSIIALENYRARFNWAFGIEKQGFSDGTFCVPPEAAEHAGQFDGTLSRRR